MRLSASGSLSKGGHQAEGRDYHGEGVCEAVVAMVLPGFTAEHALVPSPRAFRGRARPIGPAAPTVQAQGQTTCEVAYIEGREGLWVVCCDMEQSPPCTATGIG
jgi:hypothetical protein